MTTNPCKSKILPSFFFRILAPGAVAVLFVGCAEVDDDEPPSVTDDPADLAAGTDDLIDPSAPIADALAPDWATDDLLDENGVVVARYDLERNLRDDAGTLLTATTGPGDYTSPRRLIVFVDAHFSGASHGTVSSTAGTWTLSPASWGFDNKISSLVVAPGCSVQLFDSATGTTPMITINSGKASQPYYVDIGSTSANDKTSKIVLSCKDTTNAYCGAVCKDASYGGGCLPIFREYVVDFSDSKFAGWNDKISSVESNASASCDGIGLWEHSGLTSSTINTGQRRLFVPRTTDQASIHDEGFGDAVSAIESDRAIQAGEPTGPALGRALSEVKKQRSWTKAFTCNLVQEVCVDYKAAMVGLTSAAGLAICKKLIGSGVVAGVAAAAAEISTGGAATPAVAPLAGYSASQITKGVGCLAAVGGVLLVQGAACGATLETYCNNNVN